MTKLNTNGGRDVVPKDIGHSRSLAFVPECQTFEIVGLSKSIKRKEKLLELASEQINPLKPGVPLKRCAPYCRDSTFLTFDIHAVWHSCPNVKNRNSRSEQCGDKRFSGTEFYRVNCPY